MPKYAFNDRATAYELKRIAEHSLGSVHGAIQPSGNELIICKAPIEGIPAIVGTTIEYALCTRMFIAEGATDTDISEDTSFEVNVYNTTGEDIEPEAYFQAARCGTAWVTVSGAGGGSVICMKSTSEITGRSGDTAGTGTAKPYTFNEVSGDYETDASDTNTYNIKSPYAQSVSTGIVIHVKSLGDSNWELIQAECEDTPASP